MANEVIIGMQIIAGAILGFVLIFAWAVYSDDGSDPDK
jgi:predicted negative regulator of RcsB-dependent stress response